MYTTSNYHNITFMKHTNRDLKNNIEAQDHKMNEFATSFWQVGR